MPDHKPPGPLVELARDDAAERLDRGSDAGEVVFLRVADGARADPAAGPSRPVPEERRWARLRRRRAHSRVADR